MKTTEAKAGLSRSQEFEEMVGRRDGKSNTLSREKLWPPLTERRKRIM